MVGPGGLCVVAPRGDVRGCSGGRGVCVVALGGVCVVAPGGHAWLLWGGMRGCSRGVCMVALGGGMHGYSGGGMRGCSRGGMRGCLGGACVVAPGGCAWLLRGACMVAPRGVRGSSGGGGVRGFFHEIRSMSGRYASYWNAFLFMVNFLF